MPKTATRKAATPDTGAGSPLTLPGPDVKPNRLPDVDVLTTAIAATEDPRKPGRAMPATLFASQVAKCNDRTLRRYLAGDRELPALLREKLVGIVAAAQSKAKKQKTAP